MSTKYPSAATSTVITTGAFCSFAAIPSVLIGFLAEIGHGSDARRDHSTGPPIRVRCRTPCFPRPISHESDSRHRLAPRYASRHVGKCDGTVALRPALRDHLRGDGPGG